MSETAAPTTVKDGLITFGVIYVLITASGNLATHLWMWEPARAVCLVLFASLVALYAFGTAPGRRTGWRAFLLCGAIMPGAVLLIATLGYALPLSYEAFTAYEALVAGFGVGFKVAGGYAPVAVTLILWVLGIVLAVVAAPALRHLACRVAAN